MADPLSSDDDGMMSKRELRDLGLLSESDDEGDSSSSEDESGAGAGRSSSSAGIGRPKVGKGKGVEKIDYKEVHLKTFASDADAKAWRSSQSFKLTAAGNNSQRTIWACTSHETADGQPCPFTIAAFKTSSGGREYWQNSSGAYHGSKLTERDAEAAGIDRRWMPFVDESARGGMQPQNIRARIIVQSQNDPALQGTIPSIEQARG